ncbi:Tda3 protein [Saccharomycopsis crataegensis]|uniref:Tda3 protein n=1 Tax=Saccharomycopsis crataegensis TaxID=43959 RepID=A0AAV5QHN8_9ASCO|nr:Tda3 protein [Saccharomycopsis crataegensis]
MEDFIKYTSSHSGKHEGKQHIIIVGAGIVGVCIAYYITRHPSFDPDQHYVTIIESKRVAGGASGKAGGLLALWAFPQQIVPLSFQLHSELAEEYSGEDLWDYRRLTTVSLEGDIQKSLKDTEEDEDDDYDDEEGEEDEEEEEGVLEDDEDEEEFQEAEYFHDDENNSYSDDAMSRSSKESICDNRSTNTDLSSHNGELEHHHINEHRTQSAISPQSTGSATSSVEEKATKKKRRTVSKNSIMQNEHDASNGVKLPTDLNWIKQSAIQDWSMLGGEDTTAQVHPYKFTNFILKKAIESGSVELIIGKVNEIIFSETTGEAEGVSYIPSTAQDEQSGNTEPIELLADQVVLSVGPWTSKILPDCPISGLRAHSITVLPENGVMVSPYAIFTELKISKSGFVSPEVYARKDEVYVCGEGDTAVDVPETTDDVQVVKEKCDRLFHFVGKLSPNLRKGRILKRQACYLPVLDVPSSSGPLIGETNVPRLYLASGHSCWGINNAPGTGKVMAELLLDGEASSADISALDPSLYFDASVWGE